MSLQYKRFQQRLQGAKTGILNQVQDAVDAGVLAMRTSLTTMLTNLGTKIDQYTQLFVSSAKHNAGNGLITVETGSSLSVPVTWTPLITIAPSQGDQNSLIDLEIVCAPIIEATPTVNYGVSLQSGEGSITAPTTYGSIPINQIYEIKSYASGASTKQWMPACFGSGATGQNPSVSRTTDRIPNVLHIKIPLQGIRIGTKGFVVWVWDNNKGATWTSCKLRYRTA